MKCVIFAGGEKVSKDSIDYDFIHDSYVISADKGYELASSLNVKSNLLIGDFDSIDKVPNNEIKKTFPREKDDTDLMLAIKEGLAVGCTEFVIYGATGGRLDHMIGNIQCLMYLNDHNANGKIISDTENVMLLSPGKYKIKNKKNFSLSLISYSQKVTGLYISGTKYETTDCVLENNFPLGISNEILPENDYAIIEFKSGTLLVIQSYLLTKF